MMSEVTTRSCDAARCRAVKGEANKWWVVFEHPCGVFLTTAEMMGELPDSFDRDGFARQDCCGESCLQVVLSAWTSRAHSPAIPELEEMLATVKRDVMSNPPPTLTAVEREGQ